MSLRYKLPLTYGLIALFAVLALGTALLLILNSFYNRQEIRYLQQNAQVIADMVSGLPRDEIDRYGDQIQTLATLSQTRVRIADAQDALLFDSGDQSHAALPVTLSVALESGGVRQAFSQTFGGQLLGDFATNVEFGEPGDSLVVSSATTNPLPTSGLVTPLNFGLTTSSIRQSNEVVRMPIDWPLLATGDYVELSQGPAFGDAILVDVAGGLLMAGTLAVALATLVGVWVSRRIAQPLVSLTATTEAMAAGDLSVRSSVQRDDEIGQLANTFDEMAERVENTVDALKRFVADAAHEIQTPITALRTNLEVVQETPDQVQRLADAQAQVVRLQTLTESLLQLSQLDGGQQAAVATRDFQPISLATLLAARSEHHAARAEQQGQQLTVALPDADVLVQGDSQQLQTVIDNLLDNAIKFSQDGGVISAELHPSSTHAILTVTDNGIGIDGDVARVFDRFHRAPNAAAYDGSGLGLSIVQRIVEGHGGTIAVETSEHQTTFRVNLPLSQ